MDCESTTRSSFPVEAIGDDSTLKLYPFVVQQQSQNGYILVRIGCSTLTSVATSRLGMSASKLLARGHSVRDVKRALAEKAAHSEAYVDLHPLLSALMRARMVRSIDGSPVGEERAYRIKEIMLRLRFAGHRCVRLVLQLAFMLLPIGTARLCVIWARYCFGHDRRHQYSEALANVRDLLADRIQSGSCKRIARRFVYQRICSQADVDMLTIAPRRALLWLYAHSVIHGREHYDHALELKQGLILCGLHFSSAYLLLPILWLHGFSFVGAGAAPRFDLNDILDFTKAFGNVSGTAGSVLWRTKVDFAGALAIVHALGARQTALIFADGLIPRNSTGTAADLGHRIIRFASGTTESELLDCSVAANTSVEWFARQFNGPVLPVKLLRRRSVFHVFIERPLHRDSAITKQIYRRIEQDMCLHPADWSYWDRLALMRSRAGMEAGLAQQDRRAS